MIMYQERPRELLFFFMENMTFKSVSYVTTLCFCDRIFSTDGLGVPCPSPTPT